VNPFRGALASPWGCHISRPAGRQEGLRFRGANHPGSIRQGPLAIEASHPAARSGCSWPERLKTGHGWTRPRHKAARGTMSCLITVATLLAHWLGLTRRASAARLTTIISRGAFRLWPVEGGSGHEPHDARVALQATAQKGPPARALTSALLTEPPLSTMPDDFRSIRKIDSYLGRCAAGRPCIVPSRSPATTCNGRRSCPSRGAV